MCTRIVYVRVGSNHCQQYVIDSYQDSCVVADLLIVVLFGHVRLLHVQRCKLTSPWLELSTGGMCKGMISDCPTADTGNAFVVSHDISHGPAWIRCWRGRFRTASIVLLYISHYPSRVRCLRENLRVVILVRQLFQEDKISGRCQIGFSMTMTRSVPVCSCLWSLAVCTRLCEVDKWLMSFWWPSRLYRIWFRDWRSAQWRTMCLASDEVICFLVYSHQLQIACLKKCDDKIRCLWSEANLQFARCYCRLVWEWRWW